MNRLYSFSDSQCLYAHVSLVHLFAPPLPMGRHGMWRRQGLLFIQELLELLGKLLDHELELEPSGSHPWLAFCLYLGICWHNGLSACICCKRRGTDLAWWLAELCEL